jgi:hypothetical protein
VPLCAESPNFIGRGSNVISLHGDFAAWVDTVANAAMHDTTSTTKQANFFIVPYSSFSIFPNYIIYSPF